MPYGEQYQCAACKIYKSLMWRKGSNGETLCNGCHLKRVNAFLRTQRSSISKIDSRRISTKGRYGKGKSLGGKTSDRSGKNCANRGRRSIVKQKVLGLLPLIYPKLGVYFNLYSCLIF